MPRLPNSPSKRGAVYTYQQNVREGKSLHWPQYLLTRLVIDAQRRGVMMFADTPHRKMKKTK